MTRGAKLEVRFESIEDYNREYNNNLSNGGVFIATPEPPPLRSRVEFDIYPPGRDEPLTLTGEVVHVVAPDQQIPGMEPGAALHIMEFDDKLDEEFKKFLERGEDAASEGETAEESADEETSDEDDSEIQKTVDSFRGLNQENLFMSIRQLPRPEKMKLAKRGPKNIINLLIQEGDKQIMRFVVQNPRLGIAEVLNILKSPQTSMEIIQSIAKNSGWMQSDEVRYNVVTNPRTPLPVALNQLKALNTKDLAKIAKSGHVKAQLKSNALKLLMLRRGST